MIYPDTLEQKLGFDQIRIRLKSYCLSAAGMARVEGMNFGTDAEMIKTHLKQTLEFRSILEKSEAFPSRHYYDADDWLQKIALEGNYIDADQFIKLALALDTVLSSKNFLTKSKDLYPELFKLTEPVVITSRLTELIYQKIDEKSMVKDSASPDLAKIRKKLREEQSRLRRLADQLFRQAVAERWVPEGALPTVRDGRVVLPIHAEHKRKIKGFILDESATGQTVFMEPAEMLDANNEIRDLEHAEKREVIAILKMLTASMRAELPALSQSFEFLSRIDFIRAKAKFALDIQGELPLVADGPELTWYQAKHPLLFLNLKGKREVVPLNIDLDPVDRLLLVSGPNAGGKSVCLKTVGLLQYMVQCGLLIPLSDRSRVGIFRDIFLDIGDQQSIENDLSTYSSHLRNMSVFLESANDKSLVLLDELGSGTDPNFGGAIAEAVLQQLLEKRVWGVATTHYSNLKLFAGQRQGIRNAAMRFDSEHLMPLYVLDIGKPGSSFALEIARKTGLPARTLEQAEKLVGKDLAGFESLVRKLEKERVELSGKIQRLERQEAELKQSLAKYQALSSDLETRRKEIISKAKEEAAGLLKETNREIEKTIRHIRENKAERKETLKVRQSLQVLQQRVGQKKAEKPEQPKTPIREGDRVRIIGQDGSGTVVGLKDKTASVQFGDFKSLIHISKLEKITAAIEKESSPRPRTGGINLYEKQAHFNPTLDVRGKRVEEVLPLLEQFVDTALLLGHGELRILHGKGEGILRKVIREQLGRRKEVATFYDEHVERGGDGITVVVLK
ncbi:MAG TPA: endonuclease MutS2 [Chryseosolibacter sp.]|nr:endonuclease MutS2 [Chryseosolibacter sp.]